VTVKILDLSTPPTIEEPVDRDPSEVRFNPNMPPMPDEVDEDDGDDDPPPFDFVLNENSGIKIEANGKARYIASGIEVDRETYLACVATSAVVNVDAMELITNAITLLAAQAAQPRRGR